MKLTLWQKIQMLYRGYAFSHYKILRDGAPPAPFYIVRCHKHGLYTDYPHEPKHELRCSRCGRPREVNRHKSK